jgi:hypothetical protein
MCTNAVSDFPCANAVVANIKLVSMSIRYFTFLLPCITD